MPTEPSDFFVRGSRFARRELLALAPAACALIFGCERGRPDAPDAPERQAGNETRADPAAPGDVTLFLCGDVMTGRGLDQILRHPSEPTLHEPAASSAEAYVRLAESAHGPVPRLAPPTYPWGDALAELSRADVRIANLETSVTASDDWQPKGINYRMHPENVDCLTAAKLDVCVLANNHVLDWGPRGLDETLRTLERAGIATAGAGRDLEGARAPALIDRGRLGRILVFAFGAASSGIPPAWSATASRAGVQLLEDISARSAADAIAELRRIRRPGDLTVASIHWGSNWGYHVPRSHRELAHALVDSGFDVVHGHSSHHAIGIEIHRDRPIFYGCGDFLSDYEGIGGHEEYRDDLPLGYFASFDRASGRLVRLEMTPFRLRRFRLERAPKDDARWLANVLGREGARFGTTVELRADGRLHVGWPSCPT
jgi:poly-gamma-glutamate synthesis protein (capsule biosynthesis protein)